MHRKIPSTAFFVVAAALLLAGPALATNGHLLHGVGTRNQTLGGAGAAHPANAAAAAAWNPATVVALDPEVSFDVEWFKPDRTVETTIDPGAFGPGMPGFQGATKSATNAALLPSLSAAWREEGSSFTWLVALKGIAGFGVDYARESLGGPDTNVLLTPQPPAGAGFGFVKSEYQLMSLSVGGAWELDEHWAVGLVAVGALSRLEVSPGLFAAPDDANGDGFFSYPLADDLETVLGGGFRLGVRYAVNDDLAFGLAYASPLWFETYEWDSHDELGASRPLAFAMDLPAYWNAGASWRMRETTRISVDVRWIDYEETDGFEDRGYAADGAVEGFGWESIWMVGIGVEETLSDDLRVRLGYNYGENPIPSELSFFNVPAPAIVEHHLGIGLSVRVHDATWLHLGYYHAFENDDSGPIVMPQGPLAGTRVRNELSEDSFSIGLSMDL